MLDEFYSLEFILLAAYGKRPIEDWLLNQLALENNQ